MNALLARLKKRHAAIKARLARLGRVNAAQVTGILVVGLIAADLFSSTGIPESGREAGAVQNYVLFTTVTQGAVAVTTGTQFASTARRRITAQWCYLTHAGSDDALDPHVTIATATASGSITRVPVAAEALARFSLTAQALDGLVAGHCRFQRGA